MNASMILALPLVWVACAIAGYLYSQQQHIPAAITLAALPAFLLEATLFYVLGVERLRAHVERLPRAGIAVGLVLAAIAPYCAASLALGSFDWRALGGIAALAAATFFGILWVVALGEEFFFRGLLQQWVTGWLSSEWAGLLVTSVLFGAVHLWFRQFPNWRFAALAAVAGVFYGLSFRQAHSIRASMVTHALAVTAWRTFFG